MRIVSYLIEYLGKFELKFEIILDYESGDQMGSFDAKKPPSKISCLGTFNPVILCLRCGPIAKAPYLKVNTQHRLFNAPTTVGGGKARDRSGRSTLT